MILMDKRKTDTLYTIEFTESELNYLAILIGDLDADCGLDKMGEELFNFIKNILRDR